MAVEKRKNLTFCISILQEKTRQLDSRYLHVQKPNYSAAECFLLQIYKKIKMNGINKHRANACFKVINLDANEISGLIRTGNALLLPHLFITH